jgi:hypothetical protein
MRTRGRPLGSEQAVSLMFLSVAGPSIVPNPPPFSPRAEAESCEARQRGTTAGPFGEPSTRWLVPPPVASA